MQKSQKKFNEIKGFLMLAQTITMRCRLAKKHV
jgi:hypothetical protein